MILRHAVGKSTLIEGFAIPKNLESWVGAPEKGEKRWITVLHDRFETPVALRRLANSYGHVQIRYDNKKSSFLREWLLQTFQASIAGTRGEYFELSKYSADCFRLDAFPVQSGGSGNLIISEWLFHRGAERFLERLAPLREIVAITRSVSFADGEGQSYYNNVLSQGFALRGWTRESRVIPDLPLKCDFLKEGVQVEVEFGNARAYYQDYVKFLLAHRKRLAGVGVLMVPSERMARTLCQVGRQRAVEKGKRSYSGMIHLEKVRREFAYLEFLLQMPIAVAGIDVILPTVPNGA